MKVQLSASQERQIDERMLLELRVAVLIGAILYAPCHLLPALMDFLYFPYPWLGLAVRAVSILAVWLLVWIVHSRVTEPRQIVWIDLAFYVVVMGPVCWMVAVMPSTLLVGFLPSLVALAIFLPGRAVHHWIFGGAWTLVTLALLIARRQAAMALPFGYLVVAAIQVAVISAGGSYLFAVSRRAAVRWHLVLEAMEDLLHLGQELAATGLVTAGRVAQFRQQAISRGNYSRHDFVRDLIEHDQITRYQADEVLNGHAAALRIGKYLVLELRGMGGMGRVFRVRNRETGEIAALKQLLPQSTENQQAVVRFRRELAMAAGLAHPNIVRTIEVFDHAETPCLVMEYIDGASAAERLALRSPLSIAESYRLTLQVASALDYAHQRGIVHRDVKPENIMITASGVAKLGDFGLARVLGPVDMSTVTMLAVTRTGSVLGTLDYMAPEQARDPREADIRADLYSLGCTLYRLLTGQLPFDAETPLKKLLAHQAEQPRPVQSLAPEVPAELAAIVHRLMAKSPVDRFQTPAELVAALQAIEDRIAGLTTVGPAEASRSGASAVDLAETVDARVS